MLLRVLFPLFVLVAPASYAMERSVPSAGAAMGIDADVLNLGEGDPITDDLAAIPELAAAFPTADPAAQRDILTLFAELPSSSAEHRDVIIDTAAAALAMPDADVRVQALDVLSRTGDGAIIELALPMLEDPDWDVRYQALYVISPYAEAGEHPELFPAIDRLTDDPNERVRSSARSLMRYAPIP